MHRMAARAGLDLGPVETDDLGVEATGEPAQLLLVGLTAEGHRVLADDVAVQHQDEEGMTGIERDQVQVLDGDTAGPGTRDDAQSVDGHGEHLGGQLQDPLDVGGHDRQAGLELTAHAPGKALLLHQEIDVVPVAAIAGHTAGGGVGLEEVAHLDQGRQLVADGGGRPARQVQGEGVRPHRHPRGGVVRDHRLEDLLLARIERDPALHGSPGPAAPPGATLALASREC